MPDIRDFAASPKKHDKMDKRPLNFVKRDLVPTFLSGIFFQFHLIFYNFVKPILFFYKIVMKAEGKKPEFPVFN